VATFTAAGAVKRGLQEAGFVVDKVAGFGCKRESLRAQLPHSATGPSTANAFNPVTPWDLASSPPGVPERVLVLGAGLAGCHLAAALANRGVQVTLLDQEAVAGAGSGNNQGVIYTRLSRRHSNLLDFGLQSFTHAANRYRQLLDAGRLQVNVDGALCGMFQQCANTAELAALAPLLDAVPALAQVLDPKQASSMLGVDQSRHGYWYPGSGWIHPGKLCHILLANPLISVIEHCGPLSLAPSSSGWRISGTAGVLTEADCVVVAAGTGCSPLLPWLPLQIIRGQTTDLATPQALHRLRAVLCHEGYIAPAQKGVHCIGATFHLTGELADLATEDHLSNLAALGKALPACAGELADIDPQTLSGRVGFRCASPDYLPLVGPVPAVDAFMQTFARLRKNARGKLPHCGDYLQGLYLSTGHGSRGLSSTPLAAELLASRICHEPPPLARELTRALAPARFLIRDLGRNRR
jgi:tRNA 5-methylaminomethyl-2-thiouridine biosynthesis bifunctional protein